MPSPTTVHTPGPQSLDAHPTPTHVDCTHATSLHAPLTCRDVEAILTESTATVARLEQTNQDLRTALLSDAETIADLRAALAAATGQNERRTKTT